MVSQNFPLILLLLKSVLSDRELEVECLKNISFFAAKGNANIALGEIDKFREWIKGKMLKILPETHMFEYAEKKLFDNDKLKLHILLISLYKADFNITDIRSEKSKHRFPQVWWRIIMESSTLPDSEKREKSSKMVPLILSRPLSYIRWITDVMSLSPARATVCRHKKTIWGGICHLWCN